MTIEYAGGQYAPRTAQGHLDAYRGLSAASGVELRKILELAANDDLGSLFDPVSHKLVYRGADPLKRMSLSERLVAREPLCGICGNRHTEGGCPYDRVQKTQTPYRTTWAGSDIRRTHPADHPDHRASRQATSTHRRQ